jgi:hypothetical protein
VVMWGWENTGARAHVSKHYRYLVQFRSCMGFRKNFDGALGGQVNLIIFEHVVHLNPAGDGESSQSRAAAARAARDCPRRCKREEGDAQQ